MPLKLIPPGTRKGNKFYLILGMEAGTQYEVSTRTADKKLAQRRLVELREKILAAVPPAGRRITFAQAAELYKAYRKPAPVEVDRIDKVVADLGARRVDELTHADLVAAANRMLPGRAPATLNRWVMRPAAAILHYAAENKHCEWLRVKLFEEPRPETRAARPAAIARLVEGTEGRRRLLVMWLYYQGTRITQTLSVEWQRVDTENATFSLYDKKARRWQEFPLHADVLELLLPIPGAERVGKVFPWGDRHNVYRWLRPLVQELGITFTPHMARHALGTRLNADGTGLRTIMSTLGHQDPRSSLRYQAAETEVVRKASAKLPRLGESLGEQAKVLNIKK